ncbi:hypothetical protein ACLNGM_09870 [Aureimonas phyllosphaerae]|uniref:hypothetical protein n=1 Tax=Aureimonas phyllosphaerae TaxID=1166078 RepID=UPI003A5C2B33
MNPRILKKLSAAAAPLLPLLGDRREQFRAESHRNYHAVFMPDRRHWERTPCHPTCVPWNRWSTPRGMPCRFVTKAGRHMLMEPPSTPLKGTIMVGAMSGGEEPEWDEETAYEALTEIVSWHFTELDFYDEDCPVRFTRRLITPIEIFAAAREAITADKAGRSPRDELGRLFR